MHETVKPVGAHKETYAIWGVRRREEGGEEEAWRHLALEKRYKPYAQGNPSRNVQTLCKKQQTLCTRKCSNYNSGVRFVRYLSHLGRAVYKPYAQVCKTGRAQEENYVIGVLPT